MRYRQGLDDERDTLLWRKYRLDQLQLLADDLAAPLVDDLAQDLSDQLARVGSASESIAQLERRFFTTLAKVGRDVEEHLGGRGGTSPRDGAGLHKPHRSSKAVADSHPSKRKKFYLIRRRVLRGEKYHE